LSAENVADRTAKAEPAVDDDARIMEEAAAGRVDRFAEIVARNQSPLFRTAACSRRQTISAQTLRKV